jgi:hypothetical protein
LRRQRDTENGHTNSRENSGMHVQRL